MIIDPPDDRPVTAALIKEIRAELKLSQRQLAKAIGVSAGYIALLEAGSRVASSDVARRLQRLREARHAAIGGRSRSEMETRETVGGQSAVDDGDPLDLPFIVIFGPSHSSRLSTMDRYLHSLSDVTSTPMVRISLASVEADFDSVLRTISDELGINLPEHDPGATVSITELATQLLDVLERPGSRPPILCVDEWNPRGGPVHQLIGEVGLLARRLRVVACSDEAPPVVPGVAFVRASDLEPSPAQPSTPLTLDALAMPLDEVEAAVAARRGRLMAAEVAMVRGLDRRTLSEHPVLWLGLLRSLLRWGRDEDLGQARSDMDALLESGLGEGLEWQAIWTAIELALRSHEYERALALISRSEALHRRSGGTFDFGPAQIMHARALWEQSYFAEALTLLEAVRPQTADDACRVSNWKARTYLALGDVRAAFGAADHGRRIAEDNDIKGGAAYSLTLVGQLEGLRGNAARARRALYRALELCTSAGEMRVRPQVLTQLAEQCALEGNQIEAREHVQEATLAIADRPVRVWDTAYLALTQARVARHGLNRDFLCSMAHMLTYEAGRVAGYARRHPVVAALHAEAAACWAAAGYAHHAELALKGAARDQADWLTRYELQEVELMIGMLSPEMYFREALTLAEVAAEAGAPYLAVDCTYQLAQARAYWPETAGSLARWTVDAASVRGWKRLAQLARPLARLEDQAEDQPRGRLIERPDGTRSLVAPRRPQRPARAETRVPLPDPFVETAE